jgi:hypothetical protein
VAVCIPLVACCPACVVDNEVCAPVAPVETCVFCNIDCVELVTACDMDDCVTGNACDVVCTDCVARVVLSDVCNGPGVVCLVVAGVTVCGRGEPAATVVGAFVTD